MKEKELLVLQEKLASREHASSFSAKLSFCSTSVYSTLFYSAKQYIAAVMLIQIDRIAEEVFHLN